MTMRVASLGAAFLAGLSTSAGPCAAPRYLALLGNLDAQRARGRVIATTSFAAGLVTSYAALALVAGALGVVLVHSHAIFIGLSVAFCTSGMLTMVVRKGCEHDEQRLHLGRGFLSGISSGLVISPCCAPFVAGTGMLAAASGSVVIAGASLMVFLLGHILPVLVLGSSGLALLTWFRCGDSRDAIATIGGTLSLALGLYYGFTA